jgi:hypothetical protein
MARRKKDVLPADPNAPAIIKGASTTTYNISQAERQSLVALAGALGYKPGRGAGAKRGLPNISAMMRDLAALCQHDQVAVANAMRALGLGPDESAV